MFTHLHVHSEYSLLESSIKIKDLVNAAVILGMKAVALTDKYVMSGAIEFYKEAVIKNIKPIIGCEVCVLREQIPTYLILLIKNAKGYENLCQIISKSHLESSNPPIPAVDISYLEKKSEGIIGLSGHSNGALAYLLKERNTKKAAQAARDYENIFKGDFYIEIQRYPLINNISYKNSISEILINLAQKTHIPIVATNNICYLKKEDYKIYKSLYKLKIMSIKNNSTMELSENNEHYFKSSYEMASMFSGIPEAITNTKIITDECNFNFRLGKTSIPDFNVPRGETQESYLKKLCYKELRSRYKNNPSNQVLDRLNKELKVIIKKGFCGYFLIVADMARFTHENNILICGKGSAAGSLVSYILKISNIDPIKNNLYFERFLNKERKKLPDIDVDVSSKKKACVLKYLSSKYGKKNIARVCSFSTIKPRAAIREAGRILNLNKEEVDHIIKAIPNYRHFFTREDIEKAIKEYNSINIRSTTYKKITSVSKKIEGFVRHVSMHPSAFIVSNSNLAKIIPLTLSETGEIMSQYNKNSIEDLGLLKIDLINSLSLSMLSDIADILKNKRNINLSFSEIKHDDKKVFNLIKNGRTLGVFQLESFGIRTLARKIKPSSLNDITLLISLYRPGPQQSGMVNNFIERKFGRERITYINKDLKPILEETYGIILYQEQVMQIAIKIAGYSLSESENLRKAIINRSKEEMKTQESRFVRGALKKGYDRRTVNKIFKLISKFASYGFVKAHAAAYAELSYKTCYLKAYYPAELISMILTNKSGYYNEMQYIEEARRLGIGINLPDINRSGIEFCVEDSGKSIRTSLLSVRNLGFEGVNFIINERNRNGNFKDFFDFYYRTSNNHRLARKAVKNLIKIGAFDFTNLKRKYLLLIFYHLQNLNNNSTRRSHNSDFQNNSYLQNQNRKNLIDFTLEEKLKMEEEILGFFISANPLKYFKEELKKFNITGSKYFSYLIKNRKKEYRISGLIKNANYIYPKDIFTSGIVITRRIEKTKNGQSMLFCTIEDEDGMYESVFFSDTFKRNSKIIMNQSPVIIKGKLHLRDGAISIIAKDVISLVLLKKLENNSIKDNIKTNLLAEAGAIWKT